MCSQTKILIIQVLLLCFFFFHLDVTTEVKLQFSSLNLPSLFLALGTPCGINLFIHVLGIRRVGEKQANKGQTKAKKDPNLSLSVMESC